MKLLTAATRASLRASALIFLVGGMVFYGIIRTLINEEIDEELDVDRINMQTWVRQHNRLPGTESKAVFNYMALDSGGTMPIEGHERDSTLVDIRTGEAVPYRLLTFPVRVNGTFFRITLGKPLVEADDLFIAILGASALLGGILFLTFNGLNRRLSRRLLQPFHQALTQLEGYQLRRDQPLQLTQTGGIEEFAQLNESINHLTQRALLEYRNVKEFTANASHELQTPLAIMQTQIEVLLQNEQLAAETAQGLNAIQRTVSRLSRLNQTLLLLTKIENGQFRQGSEPVALRPLIDEKLTDLSDWIEHRRLTVATDLQPATLTIHPVLAEILVANLIGNAIKHNIEGGQLRVSLSAGILQIRNTGQPLTVDPETLFDRFRKVSDAPQSMGLGLSIVREIGHQNGLEVGYIYTQHWHQLTVTW